MKRIAIFCDGTWSRHDAAHPTNVVQLSHATLPSSADIVQQAIYLPGVGTGRGSNKLAKLTDRIAGGAFGWGMTENIEEAYRHLAFSYEPGDRIYIFGFSRGAFTARSLAGLIRACAIPARANVGGIPDAIARYRDTAEATHPDHPDSFAFRNEFSGGLTTSPDEVEWRKAQGLEPGQPLSITYLGVWDTVGALGIPGHYPGARWWNREHAFHDHALSRMVGSARHAVAIDERRKHFPPTLWDNLADLRTHEDEGWYLQHWFPGDHGTVGGGGDIHGLSRHALLWVAAGASIAESDADGPAGLAFDPDMLDAFESEADPFVATHNRSVQRAGIGRWLASFQTADRDGPDTIADVSQAARDRWRGYAPPDYPDGPWRPGALGRVGPDLG